MKKTKGAFHGLLFQNKIKSAFNGAYGANSEIIDLPAEIGETIMNLKKTVVITDGGVDYCQLRMSQPYERLIEDIYPKLLTFDLASLVSREEKLAFWINLYNLLTIDAVVQNEIKRSVTEGWFGMFRFFRKSAYIVGGHRFSLEDIENGILRSNRAFPHFVGKHFQRHDQRKEFILKDIDPRIHFALNCASRSCPPISYYSPEKIDDQLDIAAANFLNTETRLHKSKVVLEVSRIFKWYRKDFGGIDGVLEITMRYIDRNDVRHQLIKNFGDKTMLEFLPYDWHLNNLS